MKYSMTIYKIRIFLILTTIVTYFIGCTSSQYIVDQTNSLDEASEIAEPNIDISLPERIAFILPLTQNLQAANAIVYGFLSNYFNYEYSSDVQIYIFDSTNSIEEINDEIEALNIDFIVGPLLRENVNTAVQLSPSIRSLHLNYPSIEPTNNNSYFLGLRPEDEINTIINYALSSEIKNIITFTPSNEYGQRIEIALNNASLTSNIDRLNSINYEPGASNHLTTINDAFLINESNARRTRLTNNLGTTLNFNARRRQDIDAIFAFGTSESLSILIPQIRFSFANNINIFSLSEINTNSTLDMPSNDFDRVIFSDAPYFLNLNNYTINNGDIFSESDKFNASSSLNIQRLFAFGKDIFNIIGLLNIDYFNIYKSYNGYIGEIELIENNYFLRKTSLIQFYGNNLVEVETL